jgi:hypothetical protein
VRLVLALVYGAELLNQLDTQLRLLIAFQLNQSADQLNQFISVDARKVGIINSAAFPSPSITMTKLQTQTGGMTGFEHSRRALMQY